MKLTDIAKFHAFNGLNPPAQLAQYKGACHNEQEQKFTPQVSYQSRLIRLSRGLGDSIGLSDRVYRLLGGLNRSRILLRNTRLLVRPRLGGCHGLIGRIAGCPIHSAIARTAGGGGKRLRLGRVGLRGLTTPIMLMPGMGKQGRDRLRHC